MTNSRLTDAEILELRFPVMLEEFVIRSGSGGAGRYPGGDGVTRRLRFLEPMAVSILSSHRRVPAFGLLGGGEGATGDNRVVKRDGFSQVLPSTASLKVDAGDILSLSTPGGGGYGKAK